MKLLLIFFIVFNLSYAQAAERKGLMSYLRSVQQDMKSMMRGAAEVSNMIKERSL